MIFIPINAVIKHSEQIIKKMEIWSNSKHILCSFCSSVSETCLLWVHVLSSLSGSFFLGRL